MPQITFIEHDGTTHTVEAEIGSTVMETAIRNGVTGIVAECGGACSCATCMVYVDEAWLDRLVPRSAEEEDMLDFAFDAKPTSRLSCQIKIEPALDGLVVRTPAYQGR
jgi:ferredoxin, 2Fe-2S